MASILRQVNKRKASSTDAGEDAQQSGALGGVIRRNKQRVLLIPSRGVTSQMRHLVSDLEVLMPHSKKGEYTFLGAVPSFVFSLACDECSSGKWHQGGTAWHSRAFARTCWDARCHLLLCTARELIELAP
jgi:hypothetical protein